jgi:hypothetical protein
MDDHGKSLQAGPEQLLYATLLEKGMFFGLIILLVTYFIYLTGIIKPYIALTDVSSYWSLPVADYLHKTHIESGWSWIKMLGYSDFLNFIGIATLAGVTIACFLAIVPVLWKGNDKLYACLSVAEALILAFAASGLLGSGGH